MFVEPSDDSNLYDTFRHRRLPPAGSEDGGESVYSHLATFDGSRSGESSLVEPQTPPRGHSRHQRLERRR